MKNRLWPRLVQWSIVLTLPITLLVLNMRIVTGHWFVHWEYGKIDFPPDPHGLTTAERTRLAEVCVDYLATDADISLLRDLRLPDGEPAFNERELCHMADVQTVYNRLMTTGLVAATMLVGGMIILLAAQHLRRRATAGVLGGSLLALGLLGAVGGYMVLSWGSFFTTFHRVFFEGDTWIFPYSDTLIRLFPIRFWMDVATVIVGLLIAEVIVTGSAAWTWMRSDRPERQAHDQISYLGR